MPGGRGWRGARGIPVATPAIPTGWGALGAQEVRMFAASGATCSTKNQTPGQSGVSGLQQVGTHKAYIPWVQRRNQREFTSALQTVVL